MEEIVKNIAAVALPVLSLIAGGLLNGFIFKLFKKLNIDIKSKEGEILEKIATDAVEFTKEQAAEAIKVRGEFEFFDKLSTAITFFKREIYKKNIPMDDWDVRRLITAAVGKSPTEGASAKRTSTEKEPAKNES